MAGWSVPIQQGPIHQGWKLRVLSGTSIGKEFALTPARYVLGSRAPASIVIADPSIAPQHVVIDLHADRVEIRDCSGGAGVTVNGSRISSVQLAPGDQVKAGTFTFTFSNPGWRPPTSVPTGMASAAPPCASLLDKFGKLPLWVRAGSVTLIVAVALFILLWISQAPTLIPITLLAMSAVVPVAMICWVVEKYDRTGISFHTLVITFLAGGTIGVICAMAIYLLSAWLPLIAALAATAVFAPVAEEPGKLLATCWRWKHPIYDRPMDGLIIGTVAGFGFAVVETAGYGLVSLLGDKGLDMPSLLETMVIRGLSSPFCHGMWSGILAAAFWQSGRSFQRAFRSKVFWVAAAWAVGLHALWNGCSMLTDAESAGPACVVVVFACLGYAMMLVTAALSLWQYRRLLLKQGYRA
jgi:RsiW-degrading membrane proteinase PrsW (M82 family)